MVTEAQALRADQLIKQGRAQGSYFFSSLSSPDWIQPLQALDYFKFPPPPEDTGDRQMYFHWPELLYLTQMAEQAPAIVAQLLCEMNLTENYVVHEDQVRTCQLLPPKEAAAVVNIRLEEWLNPPISYITPRLLAELAKKLGTSGQPGQATSIITALTSLRPAPEQDEDEGTYLDRTPIPTIGETIDYSDVLDAISEGVGSAIESSMIEMCKALGKVLGDVTDDSWCEDISQSSSLLYDSRAILLNTIARYGVLLGASEPVAFDRILEHLSNYEHRVFHRLRLELLIRYSEGQELKIRSTLCDPATITSCGGSYEFRRLVTQFFGLLEDEEKLPYLESLAREPDLERIREFHLYFGLPELSDEEVRQNYEMRLRDELHALRESLPHGWRQRYDALIEKHGEANEPQMTAPKIVARNVADSSPYEAPELTAMSIESIVHMLKTWRPLAGAGIEEPTIGALSKRLEESIKTRSLETSSNAMAFSGLDPAYVSAVISGLGSCVSEGKPIDLHPLLDLCEWTLSQESAHERKGIAHPYEVSWDWVQGHVAELLQKVLQADTTILTMTDAPRVWELIARLCTHPDPRPDREEGEGREYLTLAINSTRGKGLEALFRYLIWLHKVREEADSSTTLEDLETQAWDCLTHYVDPLKNHSLADRAIFGSWFPNLFALSEQWVRKQVDAVFPLAKEHRALLEAVWNSFIVYTHPYSDVFEVLRDRYTWAATHLTEREESQANPTEHLIQHLMVLYGRGVVDLGSDQMNAFWMSAPVRVRARALSFVGFTLPKNIDEINDSTLARFRALADSRLRHYEEAITETEEEVELTSLGAWLGNPVFEDGWMLATLSRVLHLTGGRLERQAKVANRLESLDDSQLPTIIECLELMARAKDDQWWIKSAADAVKALLSKGLASSAPGVHERADTLQNFLVGAGFWEFRKLD